MALGNTQIAPLSQILNTKLEIPSYQREYAWEKEECEDLWNDLCDTVDGDKDEIHFFGQVVVHKEPSRLTIIDGQQRITTCTLLMSAFIYAYKNLIDNLVDKASNEALKMNFNLVSYSNYIGILPFEENPLNQTPHLKQNSNDNDFYKTLLCSPISIKKKQEKSSQDRLRKAHLYFNEQIKMLLRDLNAEEKREKIEEFVERFVSSFKVMYIEATELNEAFTIFETLNARGKDLASSDLLKNHLFTMSKDVNRANDNWNKLSDTLEDLDMTKFIRAYWNSKFEFVREKALYKKISMLVKTNKESKDLLDELSDNAMCYHDLAKPDQSIEFKNGDLLSALKGLNILKASTFYPIILAMRSVQNNGVYVFDEKDIAIVAKCIESYVFRNAVICGQTANKTEVYFASIARNISGLNYETIEEICNAIKSEMKNDEEFKNSFMDYSTNNKDRIRYIFRKIHNHLDINHEINVNNCDVHIEHIMPQDISQWPNVTEEDHETYLWYLGNLCLLAEPLNIAISNKPFNEKKIEAYNFSKIEPNNKLFYYNDWNTSTICDRQEKLCEYALQIWKK